MELIRTGCPPHLFTSPHSDLTSQSLTAVQHQPPADGTSHLILNYILLSTARTGYCYWWWCASAVPPAPERLVASTYSSLPNEYCLLRCCALCLRLWESCRRKSQSQSAHAPCCEHVHVHVNVTCRRVSAPGGPNTDEITK